jgi:pyruvate dehydrogenase E2 component (dihydrolipoamide acetyltransferase)
MAVSVPMPKLGNTVESSILVRWLKRAGETVSVGEPLCEVETDKATLEVESPASGTLLALLYKDGDEIPVMAPIAVVGAPGEDISQFAPAGSAPAETSAASATLAPAPAPLAAASNERAASGQPGASPRARALAQRSGLDVTQVRGTGPGGRIIERDIRAALEVAVRLTPLARTMVETGEFQTPQRGTGPGGRITKKDLIPTTPDSGKPARLVLPPGEDIEVIPLKGIRKLIAARMLESLQTTTQLTLNASADARALQVYRQRLKTSAPELGLQAITINDLVLFATSRTLVQFPELNSLFLDNAIHRYRVVHLGMAVDTERGLMVPVIQQAHTLSLKALADDAHRLADACLRGQVAPDELSGATFTVTNLGSLGIESFTPVLNPPQVGILGVGGIALKPVEVGGDVKFIPHLSLSLTINHQVVDGAPAARFLQALSRNLGQIELLLSL